MNPLTLINQYQDEILKTYHDLHQLAEPSWEEKNTSHYIKQYLEKAGFSVKTFADHYGLIAEIRGESPEVVALRADMDALVQEVGGVVRPNHSCGHDAHSTMVLQTALAIARSGLKPARTLRFIFQPAEEKGNGALKMMEEGALENVVHLFGIHVRPNKEVPYHQASPVIVHGSAGTITGKIKGLQAHASRPQDGVNAIEAAAFIVQKLKQIHLQTDVPHSIKMTKLKVENEASNVIPETAIFTLDARAQTNEVMSEIRNRTEQIIKETMEETGAVISWTLGAFVPAATVNHSAMKFTEKAIVEILGEKNLVPACISQGGEDFHFYTVKNPGLSATMVGLGCDLTPGLHHPEMKFNVDALIYGTKILTQTILLASNSI